VGFGSLRTLRAETATTVPLLTSDLSLRDGRLVGTVQNDSEEVLERPAIVLGGSVLVLRDMPPGTQHNVDLAVRPNQFGQRLADRILGTVFLSDAGRANETTQRNAVRHAVVDQLTYDPVMGHSAGLTADTPVLLAWGRRDVLDVRISGQLPRRTGNVLYYVPLPMRVQGKAVFEGELIRPGVVEADTDHFAKDPSQMSFGRGSLTMSFRPIPFEGSLATDRVTFGVGFGEPVVGAARGGDVEILDPQPCRDEETDEPDCVEPVPPDCDPLMKDCNMVGFDGMPEVELFDRSDGGKWVRIRKPAVGRAYELPDPERYVDPGSGTLLVRFVNEFQDAVGFSFQLRIEGTVK
jgi:hypothetical protein